MPAAFRLFALILAVALSACATPQVRNDRVSSEIVDLVSSTKTLFSVHLEDWNKEVQRRATSGTARAFGSAVTGYGVLETSARFNLEIEPTYPWPEMLACLRVSIYGKARKLQVDQARIIDDAMTSLFDELGSYLEGRYTYETKDDFLRIDIFLQRSGYDKCPALEPSRDRQFLFFQEVRVPDFRITVPPVA